jgi:hypothetical protein
MMKAFNVILITRNPNSSMRVKQTLQDMGKMVEEDSGIPYVSVMKVLPDNQNNTCATIRNLIRADVDVFSDKVMVSLISRDYVSYINWDDGEKLLKANDSGESPMRNFQRFENRHEASLAFELEKPRWVYDDGVNMSIKMELDEWCWLPVKGDGIYERSKYEKYLLG